MKSGLNSDEGQIYPWRQQDFFLTVTVTLVISFYSKKGPKNELQSALFDNLQKFYLNGMVFLSELSFRIFCSPQRYVSK